MHHRHVLTYKNEFKTIQIVFSESIAEWKVFRLLLQVTLATTMTSLFFILQIDKTDFVILQKLSTSSDFYDSSLKCIAIDQPL